MNITVNAKKILGPMSNFSFSNEIPHSIAMRIDLGGFGNLVGIYKNKSDWVNDCLLVTENGILIIQNKTTDSFLFRDIVRAETPEDKTQCYELRIAMKSGRVVSVPVKGGAGRFRDVFEFLRFIDRVTSS